MPVSESDFFKKFPKIAKEKIPALAEKGLARAGMLWMTDASTDIPKTPHDEGTLRASGSVFVDAKLIGVSEQTGIGTPALAGGEKGLVATVVFNTPYARRLHEHPEYNFTEAGTGARYLSSKGEKNHKHYMAEVADTIREGSNA